jgi:type IV fimbrial biogenesis protein FimT
MPSRALNGRDPQKGKIGFSAARGFTFIEMMVVIAVIAIITSLALPSYRTIIEKRQVTSGAEQLGAFLSAVQMEAVKRSENIAVDYTRTDAENWCVGITIGLTACDCTETDTTQTDYCQIDGQARIFNETNLNYPGVMNAMNGDGEFVFDPARGLVYNDSGLAAYDSAEMELLSEDGTYSLNVQISATGRVKYCSDSADKQVPGYDVCAN